MTVFRVQAEDSFLRIFFSGFKANAGLTNLSVICGERDVEEESVEYIYFLKMTLNQNMCVSEK